MFPFTLRAVTLVVVETMLILLAVLIGARVRLEQYAWEILLHEGGIAKSLVVAGVTQVCLYYADLYSLRRLAERRDTFIRMVQALGAASLLLAGFYYWFPSMVIGRGVFAIAAVLAVVFVILWRLTFVWLSGYLGPRERLLLVGTGGAAVSLAREMYERRHDLGVEIVGFVDVDRAMVGMPVINPGVIGTVADIPRIVDTHAVDRVVVSLGDARGRLPMDQLLSIKMSGVAFDHLASVYEQYTGKIAVENLRPSWFIFSEGFAKGRALLASKRLLDVCTASIGLLIGLPVMAVVAVAVRLTSEGPVLYHQQRVGRHGKPFMIHKFRTMRMNAEAATGAVWASKAGDPRVTPVGSWLRRTRLDEMPQLWNVLIGEMSFVGPRPERPEFVTDLLAKVPYYEQRHTVRPGITGWAQVRYTYGASIEDALEKLQYDLFYIKHLSISLDLFIIAQTVKTVVRRAGA